MTIRFTISVLTVVACSFAGGEAAAAVDCAALPPHLEGRVEFRGDQWVVRLHAPASPAAQGDSVAAQLDIPDMLMAGRPAILRCDAGTWRLELPFGLGEVGLPESDRGGYRGASSLAGDSLRVTLTAGEAPPYRTEDVGFRNGDVELRGTLYIPDLPGPHPAIVMVHGSGAQGRHMLEYRSWGDFHARRGVATLIYDKRGVGESGGNFREDSAFAGLTGDVLAAVQHLSERQDIDRSRIGLSGASQAGWIAYRAARDPRVAFLALLVPPSVSVPEQEIQRVRAGMRAAGLSTIAIDAAVAHTRLLFSVAVSGIGWDALQESTRRVSGEDWAEWVSRPQEVDDLRWWRDHAGVDPAADLNALKIPVFAAFSHEDPVVPPMYNAGVLRELQARSASHAITVITVARGNHRLETGAGRDARGRWHLPRVSSEVIDGLTEWLEWQLTR